MRSNRRSCGHETLTLAIISDFGRLEGKGKGKFLNSALSGLLKHHLNLDPWEAFSYSAINVRGLFVQPDSTVYNQVLIHTAELIGKIVRKKTVYGSPQHRIGTRCDGLEGQPVQNVDLFVWLLRKWCKLYKLI